MAKEIMFYQTIFLSLIFTVTIIKQTYGSSIWSRRKFRVQPLAGEPQKNVIRDGPLEDL